MTNDECAHVVLGPWSFVLRLFLALAAPPGTRPGRPAHPRRQVVSPWGCTSGAARLVWRRYPTQTVGTTLSPREDRRPRGREREPMPTPRPRLPPPACPGGAGALSSPPRRPAAWGRRQRTWRCSRYLPGHGPDPG